MLGARKQIPNLEIQICFHLQLLALDYIVLKSASELNKLLLLMWLSFDVLVENILAMSGLLVSHPCLLQSSSRALKHEKS